MTKFTQQYDGEWFRPRKKAWLMRCCKCKVVHRVNFKVSGTKVFMQVFNLGKITNDKVDKI